MLTGHCKNVHICLYILLAFLHFRIPILTEPKPPKWLQWMPVKLGILNRTKVYAMFCPFQNIKSPGRKVKVNYLMQKDGPKGK